MSSTFSQVGTDTADRLSDDPDSRPWFQPVIPRSVLKELMKRSDAEGWKTHHDEALFANPHIAVHRVQVTTPTRHEPFTWTVAHRKAAVQRSPMIHRPGRSGDANGQCSRGRHTAIS